MRLRLSPCVPGDLEEIVEYIESRNTPGDMGVYEHRPVLRSSGPKKATHQIRSLGNCPVLTPCEKTRSNA